VRTDRTESRLKEEGERKYWLDAGTLAPGGPQSRERVRKSPYHGQRGGYVLSTGKRVTQHSGRITITLSLAPYLMQRTERASNLLGTRPEEDMVNTTS